MRAAAKEQYEREGELEIDDDATISRGVDNEAEGAYVAAWVWVCDADAEDTKFKETVFKRRMGRE